MNDTIITSIISIVGVVISVTVSIFITRTQYKVELEKIKRQLEQEYAKSLFDKRVATYPMLYSYLSGYVKIIQYKKQNKKNLAQLRDNLDGWNNKNGIFFTMPTGRLSARFRRYLNYLLGSKSQITDQDWKAISVIIGHFESFIRAEIGVSSVQPVGNITGIEDIYKFIDERIQG